MKQKKKFAELIDCIYKEKSALSDKIEKGIIDLLKANGLTEFNFNPEIAVLNTDDFSNDGYVYRVFLGRSADDTQDMLGIEAAWQSSEYLTKEEYNTTEFCLEDLIEIFTQLYSQIN